MSDARPGAIVVGTGFGTRVHVPALRAAGFEVRALVGRDTERTERRAARAQVEHGFVSLDDALGLGGVEVVTVATPPSTHEWIVIAALEAGKHVICEKPFAQDGREARRMFDAADVAGTIALVGHEFRWAPERVAVMRALASGAIGEPRLASLVQLVSLVAAPETRTPDWWFDPAWGGGWLGASGSHVVDEVRVWLGEFESVSATVGLTSARDVAAEDSFTVRFRLRSGVDGVMQQSAGTWGPAAGLTRVAGTAGTVWVEGRGAWLADAGGIRPLVEEGDTDDAVSDDPRERFTHLELGPYTSLCRALRARIDGRADDSGVPVPTFADGLAVTGVLDAIRRSAADRGARVEIGEH